MAQAHLIFHKIHYGLLKALAKEYGGLGIHAKSMIIMMKDFGIS